MKPERRFIQSEVRATDGPAPKITGHAATFNSRSQDLGGFVEIIAPGAFDACLASSPDILGLYNHSDAALPLGRALSGTCRVFTDGSGLAYEIDPPDTQLARDLLVSMKRGDVRGSSFGFYCLEDDWDIDRETDQLIRTVRKAEVFDVSVVTNPAYLASDASVRGCLPGDDAQLRTLATEKRAALNAPPVDVAREDAARMELLLYLAAR